MGWLCQTGSNRGSQGSRTTLSATRQEVPKNIQKPYTLVTFDGMHQKIFEEVPSFFRASRKNQVHTQIMYEKILSVCAHFLICIF